MGVGLKGPYRPDCRYDGDGKPTGTPAALICSKATARMACISRGCVARGAFRRCACAARAFRALRTWREGHSVRCPWREDHSARRGRGARSVACVVRALAIHGAMREISAFPKTTPENARRKRRIGPPCTKMRLFRGRRRLGPWKSCKTLHRGARGGDFEPDFPLVFGKVEKPCNGQDARTRARRVAPAARCVNHSARRRRVAGGAPRDGRVSREALRAIRMP